MNDQAGEAIVEMASLLHEMGAISKCELAKYRKLSEKDSDKSKL